MRKKVSFEIKNIVSFKKSLTFFAKKFSRFCILESNAWEGSSSELIAGIDLMDEIVPDRNSFETLKKIHGEKKDWLFGFFSYELKNETSPFTPLSLPIAIGRRGAGGEVGFPLLHFFQPKYVFCLTSAHPPQGEGNKYRVEIHFLPDVSSEEEVKNLFDEISCIHHQPPDSYRDTSVYKIQPRISEQEYISIINRIKNHIQRGDIYEMNYCMEFFAEEAEIDPAEVFLKLNETSKAPFSAFYRMNDNYLMCASPERFLKKEGRKIISQPIKGTAKRGKNPQEDLVQKEKLANSVKDKSENVMIVDLVRNDLSRTCDAVKVEELFGIYTFKQWHQMISTVGGEMKKDIHFADVIQNAFPMGSMTGAPKLSAMKLIGHYEKTKRGLYSGAVGYITPPLPPDSYREERGLGGEAFDFNVVIRSILYNASSKYLSFSVGSAITANSIPEEEYEECLLKAKGMFEALEAHPRSLPFGGEYAIEKSESVF